jgi:hypothetical protein
MTSWFPLTTSVGRLIVKDNDFAFFREAVNDRRIQIIEVSGEVLVKDKGQTASLAPAPISEANAVGINKLSGKCRCCIRPHCLVVFRHDR